jgi:hypothetical protein
MQNRSWQAQTNSRVIFVLCETRELYGTGMPPKNRSMCYRRGMPRIVVPGVKSTGWVKVDWSWFRVCCWSVG